MREKLDNLFVKAMIKKNQIVDDVKDFMTKKNDGFSELIIVVGVLVVGLFLLILGWQLLKPKTDNTLAKIGDKIDQMNNWDTTTP